MHTSRHDSHISRRSDARSRAAPLLVALAALAVGQLTGCGADGEPTGNGSCDGGRDGGRCLRDGGDGGGGGLDAGPRPTDLTSIEIVPANPVLTATATTRPTQTFTVTGRQRNGTTRAVSSGLRFRIENVGLGTIGDTSGVFTSAGVGGATTVRVSTLDGSSLSAQTMLTVNFEHVLLGTGVVDADRARFDGATAGADPAMSPNVDYPLAGAVMPQNVFPPRVMWTPRHASVGASDIYRVRLVRPHATLTGYFLAASGFDFSWQIPEDVWRTYSQSDVDTGIATNVSVLSGTTRHDGTPLSFRTVNGVIAGSVYYWSPSAARLRRLDVEPARLVDFMPSPGDSCIGCHSVSRDGQRLAGVLEGSGEQLAGYDLTLDLTPAPAPTIFRLTTPVRRCTSFNGNATRLVAGDCGANDTPFGFSLIDAATGVELPAGAVSPGNGYDPEWSPDSRGIAFTSRENNLMLTTMAGDTAMSTVMVHAASASPGGAWDWHPTWSPDSQWLAFQHGDTRRTGVDMGAGVRGSIWLTAPREGATAVRLNNLNGGAMQDDAYRPIFSPFNSGGYFWVLFTATRNYGNATAGVRGQKQIWVAAIRNRPDGTTDASEVPYYLAGQEVATALSPFWAPPPCRGNGTGCNAGDQCCSGECGPDEMGGSVCRTASSCRARGASCGGGSDCCEGLVCTEARICDYPLPG